MRLDGRVPEQKLLAAKQLADNVKMHKALAVADLAKVRSSQILEMRKKLRGKVKLLVTKNMLFRKAAKTLEKERANILEFADSLSGPNLFLFTNIDPFELAILLDKSKVRVPAKEGDTATSEIMVPAGNTGLPPGPIISEFSEAKIPTRIEAGSIWVSKDTVVANKGDVISARVASVLSKLGVKPIEARISLKAAYDEGLIFSRDDLQLDLKGYSDDFALAVRQALGLAVEANYVTPETAQMILGKAHRQALALAVDSEYPAEIAMPEILKHAFIEMKAVSESLASVNKEAAPVSFEAPAPAQVIPPIVEEPSTEKALPEEARPPEVKVVPTATPPKVETPLEKAQPLEAPPAKPEKAVAEKPRKPKAMKKPIGEYVEPKPKKKVVKEKAKREKAKSR